ncbi:MAG TPA: sulfur transferase domain-containing protein [Gemmatimonadales bacterium]
MATTGSLQDAIHGIINASVPLPWLVVSGQPTEVQLATLRDAGLSTVIDLRESMEPRLIDEPAAVRGLGMRYVNLPVVSGALDDEMMLAVLDAMRAAAGQPTLLHCNSANRTGGPLIAYLILGAGLDESAAVDIAMRSGLRSVEVLEWATAYANAHRQ